MSEETTSIEYLEDEATGYKKSSTMVQDVKMFVITIFALFILSLWLKGFNMVLEERVLKEKYSWEYILLTAAGLTALFFLTMDKMKIPLFVFN